MPITQKISHFLLRLFTLIATLFLLFDVVMILTGVFMRYFFGGAPIWTDEIARLFIINGVMLIAGVYWLEGGHMRVPIAEKIAPPLLKSILFFYQWLLGAAIALALCIYGIQYTLSVSAFITPGLGISRSWLVVSIPVGFGLLFILIVLNLLQQHQKMRASL